MKIVLVGAGSMQFGIGTLSDIFSSESLRGSEVTLHDINGAAMERVLAAAQRFLAEHNLDFPVNATTDRRAAFGEADFIITSIEVGNRFALWDQDWQIPMQYGVRQVFGENGGPGGVFHALRIVPPILEIVRDAMEICPQAWIFNYSNPMSAIVTTVKRAFPEARFVGMCHEIGWLSRWLPPMLGVDINDLHFVAAGLNHFSCMISLTSKPDGRDLYPEVLSKAHAFFLREPGYSDVYDEYRRTGHVEGSERFEKGRSGTQSRYEWADRRLVRLMLETYGLLPITVDSHFGEYLGWGHDVVDHRGILDFYSWYRAVLTTPQEPTLSLLPRDGANERVIPIIEGILHDAGFEESAVNVLNDGFLDDLPSWLAVEVPAVVDRDGVRGMRVPGVPKGFLALLRGYAGVYDLIAEAVLRRKKDLVIQALLANPVVHQVRGVREMVDHIVALQKPWLGYLS